MTQRRRNFGDVATIRKAQRPIARASVVRCEISIESSRARRGDPPLKCRAKQRHGWPEQVPPSRTTDFELNSSRLNGPNGPILTFAYRLRMLACECWNQRTASKY